MENIEPEENKKNPISRREVFKGLLAIPLLGVFTYNYWKDKALDLAKKKIVQLDLGLDSNTPLTLQSNLEKSSSKIIRLGIIGVGSRGDKLLQSAGFMESSEYNKLLNAADKNDNYANEKLQTFYNQQHLNIEIVGICDVFDMHAEKGVKIASGGIQPNGKAVDNKNVKRYLTYQELLADKDIDAVIISTPDFHHAQMTIDAVNAGKHVYCEKAMTITEDELHLVYNTVKNSDIVFQLGHQNSKNETFKKAKEIVNTNILGKVTLIETTTNRNSKKGAWIRHLDAYGNLKPGSPESIDWKQWLGNAPKVPFNLERYYGWPRWFDYDTGLAGQLFSHEIDAMNQIMGFGIPKSVTSSGGIYFHKEDRDMPDTFQAILEFPERQFTMLYSASLANSRSRGRVFMGNDASMEVGSGINIIANRDSPQYKDKIKNGIIDVNKAFYTYPKIPIEVDATSSETEKYYADRGLINTKIGGKNINLTHLHIKEWIDVIRHGGTTGCNIDKAFDDTVAVLMVHKSYVENRKVEWDPINRKII
jgi:predicted dehydrogenase